MHQYFTSLLSGNNRMRESVHERSTAKTSSNMLEGRGSYHRIPHLHIPAARRWQQITKGSNLTSSTQVQVAVQFSLKPLTFVGTCCFALFCLVLHCCCCFAISLPSPLPPSTFFVTAFCAILLRSHCAAYNHFVATHLFHLLSITALPLYIYYTHIYLDCCCLTISRYTTDIRTVFPATYLGSIRTSKYKCRLGILESYFKNVLSTQTDIEKLDSEDGGRADLEELYITTKLSIQSQLSEDRNETWSESTCAIQTGSKLPKLKLPSFNGKYSEYQNFITSFKQVIDREYSLSNIEKFNHLRNCLQGPALETIDAFPVSNENYPKALERLKSRYDNPTLIFLENISSLFELSAISKPNGGQLRSLIDKTSAIYGSLLSLGTESQISQAMLIYLVLQKAEEETNRKWK
ncbi:uncharacterized protein [Eurosta solidaginis]|uniref:uncharacterized protein n=1 Tax=Eurosta solidaginis TaxID=178769 RepID=UPI003530650D